MNKSDTRSKTGSRVWNITGMMALLVFAGSFGMLLAEDEQHLIGRVFGKSVDKADVAFVTIMSICAFVVWLIIKIDEWEDRSWKQE